MKWILVLIFISSQIISLSQCLKADIIFLLDWSGSEDGNGQYITDAALDFTNSLNLGPSSAKIGIIPFDNSPLIPLCLQPSYDKDIVSSLLGSLSQIPPSGGTDYQSSFVLSSRFFKDSSEKRGEEVLKILIIISDGIEFNDYSNYYADDLKSDNVIIWSIGTTSGNMMDLGRLKLMSISSGPEFYSEQTYWTLKEELLKLDICP